LIVSASQDFLQIIVLRNLNFPLTSVLVNLHPYNLVCWSQVLHIKLPSQMCLQFLNSIFVGAYYQHVIHVQQQNDEIIFFKPLVIRTMYELSLLYPKLIMKESNLLYQHLDACLRPYRDFFNLQSKFSLPVSQNLMVGAYKFLI